MNAFIGTRLHSLIFAAIARTPFIALAYAPKVKALLNQLGYSPARTVDLLLAIDDFEREESLNDLAERILRMIQRREENLVLERTTTALAAQSMMSVFHGINLLDSGL
jgi:polysaccharide pyruvyl transferase WcaK-like protein